MTLNPVQRFPNSVEKEGQNLADLELFNLIQNDSVVSYSVETMVLTKTDV